LSALELGAAREHDGRPVVAIEPATGAAPDAWSRLCALWSRLPPHPHVLEPVGRAGDTLLVRYAAIDREHPRIGTAEMAARWAVQLTDALAAVAAALPAAEAAQLARPVVWIDVGGAARIGFAPAPAPRPLAHAIGEVVRDLRAGLDSGQAPELERVVTKCLREAPPLDDLRAAWAALVAGDPVRAGESLASWTLAEEGLGWLELGRALRAVDAFEAALELDRRHRVAEDGLRRAFDALGIVRGSLRARPAPAGGPAPRANVPLAWPAAELAWPAAELDGHELEQRRAFREAIALYGRARVDAGSAPFVHTAIARCYLALGDPAQAAAYAARALAVAPAHLPAHSVLARAHLDAQRYADALACAGAWLELAPGDADAQYARGRALLGLARYVDAHEALDRACTLRPAFLPAMLLRREADRAARRLRDEVGRQPALVLELPPQLASLRDALAAGRIDEAIAALERPEHAADPDAALALAQCLAFVRRFADALVAFDRTLAAAPGHRSAAVGRAHALLALSRSTEALAAFERIFAADPRDLDACEGRVRALRQLGRSAEADAAEASLIAASGGRAALRVGGVQ
jgi:tetratricopeptide (TPR) repeat protein